MILFGGKGGVGKTTLSAAAALHLSQSRKTILFTTDPASNLSDLGLTIAIESLDASSLYSRFLGAHLDAFLEIGDRGTYLDREELRRLFELSLPGVDELMAWMRIGELAESEEYETVIVDTAPTGHTLRMLSSGDHFRQLASALDAMEEKHRTLVRQFTRRDVRDAMDAFIEDFDARASRRRALLMDSQRSAFIPITLGESLVIEQTKRLMREVGIDVPFVVLNRARGGERLDFARVVRAPRACVPLDSEERLRRWLRGGDEDVAAPAGGDAGGPHRATIDVRAPLLFLAGKGGVGKTSCATSIALQLARRNRSHRYVLLSVDPAHSLRDVFATQEPPSNLSVETIDTKAKWRAFRDTIGREVEAAVDALTPRGVTIEHDVEAMRQLIEIAPPGADELFAITRLADLIAGEANVIVDTAPTGHFLRLLDLPREAGEWVREFMRLLLRYKDLVPPASLGEELVRASRALKELDETLRSERTAVVVVTRPERIVVAETKRLMDELRRREIAIGGVIANYVTPKNDDAWDQSMRNYELANLADLGDAVLIERRATPPVLLDDLEQLVSLDRQ
ncbi:MAG TPA: ArsA family ATPase [Thermoanaerobaculia bacterium]|nr:ArsA family ATPase [Thermoanaerobaculia bacterium]